MRSPRSLSPSTQTGTQPSRVSAEVTGFRPELLQAAFLSSARHRVSPKNGIELLPFLRGGGVVDAKKIRIFEMVHPCCQGPQSTSLQVDMGMLIPYRGE
jgi:hypothetical protein